MTAIARDDRFDGVFGTGRGRPDIESVLRRDEDEQATPALLKTPGAAALKRLCGIAAAEGIDTGRGCDLARKLADRALDDICRDRSSCVVELGRVFTTADIGEKFPYRLLEQLDEDVTERIYDAVTMASPYDALKDAAAAAHRSAFLESGTVSVFAAHNSVLMRARARGLRTAEGATPGREAITRALAIAYDYAVSQKQWKAEDVDPINEMLADHDLKLLRPRG